MTEQEAIDGLRFTMDMMTWRDNHDDRGAYNVDPSELNEDSRITYDSCKSAIQALQKQIPQKPTRNIFDSGSKTCICGNDMSIKDEYNYCPYCGQRIDWD